MRGVQIELGGLSQAVRPPKNLPDPRGGSRSILAEGETWMDKRRWLQRRGWKGAGVEAMGEEKME